MYKNKALGIRIEIAKSKPQHFHEYKADNDYKCKCGAKL